MTKKTQKQQFNLKEFLEKADIPAIPITINDKDYIMLVDTGSDASYLDSNVLNKIQKNLLGYQDEIVGGTGIKGKGSAVYEVKFNCGNKEFTEEFTENNFTHIFDFVQQNTGIRLSGILGTRFLVKNKCILDFDELVFYL